MASSTSALVAWYYRTSLSNCQCSLFGKAGLQTCWQRRLWVSTQAMSSSSQLMSCLCWLYKLARLSSASASSQSILSRVITCATSEEKLDLCRASTGAWSELSLINDNSWLRSWSFTSKTRKTCRRNRDRMM